MKRGLVFTLCAVCVAASASLVQAQANVTLSLNLRYTDPADVSEGGRWFLMAQTSDPDGIAGISAYIANINDTGIVFGNPTAVVDATNDADYPVVAPTTTGANVTTDSGTPYKTTFAATASNPDSTGPIVNVVYGQNLAAGPVTNNVGNADGPGNSNFVNDPLQRSAYNNFSLIASGTFGASRPAVALNVGTNNNNTGANTLVGNPHPVGTAAVLANTTIVVRGDALQSSGLEGPGEGLARGDANRDFDVDSDDLDIVLNNFDQAATLWDQGDFNDDGMVDSDDLDFVLNNFDTTQNGPSIASVPEPSSVALLGLAAAGLFGLRRRVR